MKTPMCSAGIQYNFTTPHFCGGEDGGCDGDCGPGGSWCDGDCNG